MILCEVCGNEMPDSLGRCGYCGSKQRLQRSVAPSRRNLIRTVNIESGLPVVQEGLARLEAELLRARHDGVQIVRVIHGWGSSGTGGKLRLACRAYLKQKLETRQIKSYLPGEEYYRSGGAGKNLLSRYPALKNSERKDRCNPGITFVEL